MFHHLDVLDELRAIYLPASSLLLFCWFFSLQDLKPRFHSSRLHGSDNAEDDVRCVNIFLIVGLLVSINR